MRMAVRTGIRVRMGVTMGMEKCAPPHGMHPPLVWGRGRSRVMGVSNGDGEE